MSLAKLSFTAKSRKEFECTGCRQTIPKGSSIVRFTVGFRSRYVQSRHNDPEHPKCFPKPSERESSLVSSIYAAQEEFDVSTCTDEDDVTQEVNNVQAACDEVIGEYENNEMFDKSPDMQERVDMLNSARDELDNWNNDVDVPDPGPEEDGLWDEDVYESWEQHHDAWIDAVREAAQAAVDQMEIP